MGGRSEYVRKVDSATQSCNATFSIMSFVTIVKPRSPMQILMKDF
jgi:hypothetical protein